MALTRRHFLRLGGCTGMALALAATLDQESAAASAAVSMQMGVLIDISRCIGCRTCEATCKKANNLPEETQAPGQRKLTAHQWTFVDKRQVPQEGKQVFTRFVKNQCMHCLEPACVSVCPVGALHKAANGAVIYDDSKCIGCRYCMTACPFDVPRYEWDSATPLIRKCQFCISRTSQGQSTACSAACPAGTIKTGLRSELLAEAAERIRQNPARYVDYIYGKDEVGGTAALYLSNIPFAELGFRMDLPKDPLPQRTNEVMTKLPPLVMGLAVVLGAGTVLSSRNGNSDSGSSDNGKTDVAQTTMEGDQ